MNKRQLAQMANARVSAQTECYIAIGLLAMRLQSCTNSLSPGQLVETAPLARVILDLASAAGELGAQGAADQAALEGRLE